MRIGNDFCLFSEKIKIVSDILIRILVQGLCDVKTTFFPFSPRGKGRGGKNVERHCFSDALNEAPRGTVFVLILWRKEQIIFLFFEGHDASRSIDLVVVWVLNECV